MSTEQLEAFLEKIKTDTSLQEQLKLAADVNVVIAIAKEAGYTISADDLKSTQSGISEEELEKMGNAARDRIATEFSLQRRKGAFYELIG